MSYRVEVEYSPVYELTFSLVAYLDRAERKILELKPGWFEGIESRLAYDPVPDAKALEAEVKCPLHLLLPHLCPEPESVTAFMGWLESLSPGDLYELLTPLVPQEAPAIPSDLGGVRDRLLRLLAGWHEAYFRHLDPAILTMLAQSAAAHRALVGHMDAPDLVEQASGGLRLESPPWLELVRLVPQYHLRPLNVTQAYRGLVLIAYPVDPPPATPETIPDDLRRLTRALADESRLRILRFLSGRVRSFTEVVEATGLAKSTVHHHMAALRSAGLVRVHLSGPSTTDRYSLRDGALNQLGSRLAAYLKGEERE